jgi:hypothetical protein
MNPATLAGRRQHAFLGSARRKGAAAAVVVLVGAYRDMGSMMVKTTRGNLGRLAAMADDGGEGERGGTGAG